MFGGWGMDCTFDDEDDPINTNSDDKSISDDDGMMSPAYSDRYSSDVEECMYGKIHHSLNVNSEFLGEGNNNDDSGKNNSLKNRYFSEKKNESQRGSVYENSYRNFSEGNSRTSRSLPNDSKYSFLGSKTRFDSSIPSQKKSKVNSPRKRLKKNIKKHSNVQASTPIPCDKQKPSCSFKTEGGNGDGSSDEVVFVSVVDCTEKHKRSCSNFQTHDSQIISKTSKHSSVKKNCVISVSDSSGDSSDEMICIDSTGSGDDLMTNVKSDSETYSVHNYSSSGSDSTNLAEPAFNADSSESNVVRHISESWHIDAEDRMANYLGRKSRKRKWASTCKQCKGIGHNEYQCSYIRDTKCYLCGGSHKSSHCNKKVCGLCYSLGHDRTQCSYPMHSVTCGNCKVVGHMARRCPDIWRRYHVTTSPSPIKKSQENLEQGLVYCYNCGIDGHLGHQCHMPRLCRESVACLPYIISYKDPDKLMRTCPKPAAWEGKLLKKKMVERRNAISKFSKTSDFQRTLKSDMSQEDNELRQLLKIHKRRSFRKKRKSSGNKGIFLQRNSL